jgi:hypothetical protein
VTESERTGRYDCPNVCQMIDECPNVGLNPDPRGQRQPGFRVHSIRRPPAFVHGQSKAK